MRLNSVRRSRASRMRVSVLVFIAVCLLVSSYVTSVAGARPSIVDKVVSANKPGPPTNFVALGAENKTDSPNFYVDGDGLYTLDWDPPEVNPERVHYYWVEETQVGHGEVWVKTYKVTKTSLPINHYKQYYNYLYELKACSNWFGCSEGLSLEVSVKPYF